MISSDAVCVIAGMISIGFVLQEDKECFEAEGTREARKARYDGVVLGSVGRYDGEVPAREGYHSECKVDPPPYPRTGGVNSHLMQFLSGHGYAYVKKQVT